jgi:hypothetical protein
MNPDSTWVEYEDDDGDKYYFDSLSERTVWDPPPEGVARRSKGNPYDERPSGDASPEEGRSSDEDEDEEGESGEEQNNESEEERDYASEEDRDYASEEERDYESGGDDY